MASQETPVAPGPRRRTGVIGWAVVGFGMACLMCAVVLTVYAAAAADSPRCLSAACHRAGLTATTLAWVMAAACLLVATALLLRIRSVAGLPRVSPRLLRLLALACAVLVTVAVLATGMVSAGFAASGQRVWLVRVGAAFAVAGCVTVAGYAGPSRPWGGRPAAVAVAAAVVVVLALATLAWRDERNTIDATTAAPVDVPTTPAQLGQERFRLTLPFHKPRIESAGAGFVVFAQYWAAGTVPEVVAFDASGNERWHYSRTNSDPWRIERMRVYDGGGIIAIGMSGRDDTHTVLGLDAVTGARVWMSTDPDMWAALDVDTGGSFHFFMVRGDERWTAFDARTGQQAWRIPNPAACGPGPLQTLTVLGEPLTVRPADTPTRLVTVVDCSTADAVRVRVLVTDPTTGDRVVERAVTPIDGRPRTSVNYLNVGQADDDTVNVRVSGLDPSTAVSTRFNYNTGQSADYPNDWLYSSQQSRGDFLVLGPSGNQQDVFFTPGDTDVTARLYNADQTLRCQFDRRSRGDWPPKWLTDQLVVLEFSPATKNREIRVVSRDDCRTDTEVPVPLPPSDTAGLVSLRPAAGVTLLARWHDASTVDIIGYAP